MGTVVGTRSSNAVPFGWSKRHGDTHSVPLTEIFIPGIELWKTACGTASYLATNRMPTPICDSSGTMVCVAEAPFDQPLNTYLRPRMSFCSAGADAVYGMPTPHVKLKDGQLSLPSTFTFRPAGSVTN